MKRPARGPAVAALGAALLAAAAALSGCSPAADIETLLADLSHPDIEVRLDADQKITSLIRRGEYRVVLRGLDSPNLLVRAESIAILAQMSQPAARAALRDLLRVDRRMMLPFNPIRMKPASEPMDSRILVAHLIDRGGGDPSALGILLGGIDGAASPEALVGTCYAIGALRDPGGIEFLRTAGGHADLSVARAAAQALGQFKDAASLAVLASLSTHSAIEVRSDVLSSLAMRRADEILDLLKGMGALDPAPEIRIAAIGALALSPPSDLVAYLIDRLGDGDAGVRAVVVSSLGARTGQSLGPRPEPWRRWWSRKQQSRAASR